MNGTLKWTPLLPQHESFAKLNMTLYDTIIERLDKKFAPTFIELIDETDKHKQHKQFQTRKSHFKLHIASVRFATLSTLEAHQEIYACLEDLMHNSIHALSIHIHK